MAREGRQATTGATQVTRSPTNPVRSSAVQVVFEGDTRGLARDDLTLRYRDVLARMSRTQDHTHVRSLEHEFV